jgi:uncharacterized protein YgiM (DUF1202 family)/surface antigen
MNRYKKLVFAFFVSAALMNSRNMINTVHADSILPNIQSSAYTAVGNIFAKCGYRGQCTWFTYGRVLEKLGIALPSEFYGNAVEWWYANARDNVYPYGYEPRANSIVVWGGGPIGYGHVGFVEKVEGDTVYFNEGNFSIRGNYDGNVKTLSKEAIKNRGNLYLKGYIYVGNGRQSVPASSPGSGPDEDTDTHKTGFVNISSNNSCLNIRNGAGTSFGILGSLKKGQSIEIVGSVGSWYKIKLNSSYGYVASTYISTDENSSTPTSNSKTGYIKLQNSSSYLNLRSAPQGPIIGSLSNGTQVTVLGSSGSWCKITAGNKTGYIYSSYMSFSQPASVPANSKTGTVILKNRSSVLNLRNNPWTGRVLAALPYGSKVTILSTDGRWYKVQAGSVTGYVHSDYIRV